VSGGLVPFSIRGCKANLAKLLRFLSQINWLGASPSEPGEEALPGASEGKAPYPRKITQSLPVRRTPRAARSMRALGSVRASSSSSRSRPNEVRAWVGAYPG